MRVAIPRRPPAGSLTQVQIASHEPVMQAVLSREIPELRPARQAGTRLWRPAGSPLLAVLCVQAALSLRLVWANTAFQDEALYLRSGHLEWAHWLHGAAIPDFPSYFSGAPVLYPPLAALADDAGGLAAARLLSLCFMLGATALLWATTRRLYGRRAALLAAALFATLAGTQVLGAFATYDALALFLLGLAAWLTVRSADCSTPARLVLLTLAGVTLAGADAVKYATVIFTPVVVIVAAASAGRQDWVRRAPVAGLTVLGAWLAVATGGCLAGGPSYWRGLSASTLHRSASNVGAGVVLQRAYIWTSLVLVLAALGAFLALRSKERARFLPAALLAAAVLAPAAQARLHTTVSVQKHVVFGAWFAAIAAGYALARLSRVDRGNGWAPVMAIPIAASTLFGSLGQASALFSAWPDSAGVVRVLRSEVATHPGSYLAEDYDVEAYYLRGTVPWQRWTSTYYYRRPGTAPGAASYAAAISRHSFALVILDFGDTVPADREIAADMTRAGGYRVLARAGRFTVWASQPGGGHRGGS
jgi:4-amino-4-deoxy-L-arabinose transferase-like glycosyltransferase